MGKSPSGLALSNAISAERGVRIVGDCLNIFATGGEHWVHYDIANTGRCDQDHYFALPKVTLDCRSSMLLRWASKRVSRNCLSAHNTALVLRDRGESIYLS